MSNRDKDEIDPLSSEHREPISITIEIHPTIEPREGKPPLTNFYCVIDGDTHHIGEAGYFKDEHGEVDWPNTLGHFTRAREYITKYIADAMEDAARGLVREATEMHGAPAEVIDKQIDSSLDLTEQRRKAIARSRLLDKMFKELIDAGMTREEAIKEHHKRVNALPFDHTWFQDVVCRYANQVAMRLRGQSFWWVKKGKRWRVDDEMLERFRFFEVHEKWSQARKILRREWRRRKGTGEIIRAITDECGPLADDLLEALFEWSDEKNGYKWEPIRIASVDAARQLHFDKATMEQAESLYDFFREQGERVMYKKPPQEVLDRIERERQARWERRMDRYEEDNKAL